MSDSNLLTDEQLDAYLERLRIEGRPPATKETLDALVYSHQCNVPFETVDMHHCEEPPSLETDVLFDKLVTRKRGGYCFELNFLFETLLRTLGFNARSLFGRFIRGRDVRPSINHQSVTVELDGKQYITDVGIGGPLAAGALLLEDGLKQTVRGEIFITRKINDSWWAIDRQTEGKKDLYGDEGDIRIHTEVEITTTFVEPQDFTALNLFFSQPGSLFYETYLCNRRTPTGYHGFRGKTLTIRKDGVSVKTDIEDKQEFDDAIEKYFGFRPE